MTVPERESNTYTFQVTDANHAQIAADKKEITLVEDPPGIDGKPVRFWQGNVYHPARRIFRPINLFGQYGKVPDTADPKLGLFKTVEWK